MSEYIRVNDYEIDPESGEIIGDMPRDYKAQLAAFAVAEADRQIESWKKYRAIHAAAVVAHQDTKVAEYDGYRVSIRQQTNRVQDVTAIKQWVTETELTRDDLLHMVLASQSGNWRGAWKLDALPEPIRDAVADMTTERTGEPFVMVETVRKAAPQVVLPEPDLIGQMEASFEAIKEKANGIR